MALLETLIDDFSNVTASNAKWTTAGTATAYTGSAFEMQGSNPNPALISKAAYTFGGNPGEESFFSAKITNIPGCTSDNFRMFVQDTTTSARLDFVIDPDGTLKLGRTSTNGTESLSVLGAYNPTTMAYLRMRTVAGGCNFEVSPDNTTWANRGTAGFPWTNANSIKASFTIYSTSLTNGVSVDNVNIIPVFTATILPTGITAAETLDSVGVTYAPSVNRSYTFFRDGILSGGYDLLTASIKLALVRDYTYDPTHRYMSDVTAAGGIINAISGKLTNPQVTGACFDADDTSLATYADPNPHVLVAYQASGPAGGPDVSDTTQALMWYFDNGTGLPVTPGVGTVTVKWPDTGGKIYKIGV